MTLPFLQYSPEVAAALEKGGPVVALESTIITHGMPWPQNARVAREVEDVVRERGATPATIAVLDGTIRIGLGAQEIDALASSSGALKLSRDNLAYAVSSGRTGSTTVAATMVCARQAGIGVFATGGIGGVHRDVERTLDISADLEEFARTPVAVVCAGAKALLDLPRTLEYLETRGVPVVGYRSDEFAAFWSRTSGLKLQIRLDSPAEIARFLDTRHKLGLTEGVVISNPVPEENEIPAREMESYIGQALQEAHTLAISGKMVTPFLLGRIFEITKGRSLDTNMALIKNNAGTAADIATAIARPGQSLRGLEATA